MLDAAGAAGAGMLPAGAAAAGAEMLWARTIVDNYDDVAYASYCTFLKTLTITLPLTGGRDFF